VEERLQDVDAEGNETASSGTKIFLYLVKGMLIYFKILRFGEVGVFFDRPPLYKLNNNSFHFNWRENINMHGICPRSLSVQRNEQFSESVA